MAFKKGLFDVVEESESEQSVTFRDSVASSSANRPGAHLFNGALAQQHRESHCGGISCVDWVQPTHSSIDKSDSNHVLVAPSAQASSQRLFNKISIASQNSSIEKSSSSPRRYSVASSTGSDRRASQVSHDWRRLSREISAEVALLQKEETQKRNSIVANRDHLIHTDFDNQKMREQSRDSTNSEKRKAAAPKVKKFSIVAGFKRMTVGLDKYSGKNTMNMHDQGGLGDDESDDFIEVRCCFCLKRRVAVANSVISNDSSSDEDSD